VAPPHKLGHWCVIDGVWTNSSDDGPSAGVVANCRDITDRKHLEEELRRKAFLDDLTACQRALFGDRVDQAVHGPSAAPAR